MKKLGVLFLGIVIAGCETQREVNEYYQGRKLRDWMQDIVNGEDQQKNRAVDVINSISDEDVDLVPALKELLKDQDPYIVWWSLHALSRIGPKAKDALPEIQKSWEIRNSMVLKKGLETYRIVANLPSPKLQR
jgi:hypothetical protein